MKCLTAHTAPPLLSGGSQIKETERGGALGDECLRIA